MSKKFNHLFGPVPSRRLGQSLGIDLTPHKTCSFDCIFCQLGATTVKTAGRKDYVPTAAVLSELDRWLKTDGQADVITLSGSGEPTLHSGFGRIIERIKEKSELPAVLLTNGSLLHLPQVRDAAALADTVKVSLSAWDQTSYGWVNRPHPDLGFAQLIEGLRQFRSRFDGQLWMEVFLIAGVNAMPADVEKIAALAKDIAPDRIQLNTAVRPPAEDFVRPLSGDRLSALTGYFQPAAEIIAEFSGGSGQVQANQDTILAMLRRRPCTAGQISDVFAMHLNEVSKYLGKLMRTGRIRSERRDTHVYYLAAGSGR